MSYTFAVAAKQKLTAGEIDALLNARHPEPRSLLGYHEFARKNDAPACVVRVLEPDAVTVTVLWEDGSAASELKCIDPRGLFEGRVPYRRPLHPYRLQVRYRSGAEATKHDPYFFAPQLSDFDLYLFGEGNHYSIYHKLGAHPATLDGLPGTRFAVWAPNAERVSVVGPFNLWDGRKHAMQARGGSGIWELFVPGPGRRHRLQVRNPHPCRPDDPEGRPVRLRDAAATGQLLVVASIDGYTWSDEAWMRARPRQSARASHLNIYEVHPASWRRDYARTPQFLNWREIGGRADPLREGHGVHARRVDGRRRASASTVRGATRSSATTRRPRASARRGTSCISSIAATRRASA